MCPATTSVQKERQAISSVSILAIKTMQFPLWEIWSGTDGMTLQLSSCMTGSSVGLSSDK